MEQLNQKCHVAMYKRVVITVLTLQVACLQKYQENEPRSLN